MVNISFWISDKVNITEDGALLTKTTFEPTEVMSTYLLAFIVSDFDYIEQIDEKLQVIIFSQGLQRKLQFNNET